MAKPISGADMEFVGAWLHQLGLGAYFRTFVDNHIDASLLPHLTNTDLAELGVSSVGHRRRLLDAIGRLAAAENLAVDGGHKPASAPPANNARPVVIVERRQVTTVFCELIGYTQFASHSDPELVHDLLGSYKDICVGLIDRFGGHVVRSLGDGVLATFGYPRAREDDAARAVASGLALVRAIETLRTPNGDKL